MIGKIIELFSASQAEPEDTNNDARRLASAALLIEVAKADADFSPDERAALLERLRKTSRGQASYIHQSRQTAQAAVEKHGRVAGALAGPADKTAADAP